MGVSENEARHMTRYLPRNGMEDLLHERNLSLENKHLEREERFEAILKTASCLDGLPRHPMMHPCGIVVADRPLTDFTPLLPSGKGFMMTQMSMEPIEDLGLLKLDLLGQAGLSVIRDTCENLREDLARMSHKSSTALRNPGTGADFVGFTTLQGVDPASSAHQREAHTSTRSSFARNEFYETCGLGVVDPIEGIDYYDAEIFEMIAAEARAGCFTSNLRP